MNRFIKKITAIAFAMVMMFSLPLAVFADEKPQLNLAVDTQDIKIGSEFQVNLRYGGTENIFVGTVVTYDPTKLELTDSGKDALKRKNENAEVEETDGKVDYSNLNREGVVLKFKALTEGDIDIKAETEALYYVDSNTFMPDEELAKQAYALNVQVKSDEPAVNETPAENPADAVTETPQNPDVAKDSTTVPEDQNMFQKFFNQLKNDWLLMVLFIAIVLIVLILIILIIESIVKGRRNKKDALTAQVEDASDDNVRRVRRAGASDRPTLYDLTDVSGVQRRETEAGERPLRRPAQQTETDGLRPRRSEVSGVDAEGNPLPRRRPVRRRPDGTPMPRRRPVKRPLDAQGNPLPRRRRPVDAQGNPLPVRRPLDANGNPLPVRRPRRPMPEGELPRRRPVRRRPDGTPMPRRRRPAARPTQQPKPVERPENRDDADA